MADEVQTETEAITETAEVEPTADDLALFEDETAESIRAGFSIHSEDTASWALSRLLALDDEEVRLRAGFAACLADIERRRKSATDFFVPQLEAYYLANRPKRGKSIKLLHGVIGTRASKGGPKIVDADAVKAWAMEHQPDFVRTTFPEPVESIDKNAVKDHVKATGEVVPGVEVEEPRESFYVSNHKGGV